MKSDIQLYPDLIKALEKNEIVYLFGAGFSTALSGRKYTWWDWIVDGIGRIKDHATADMLNEELKELAKGDDRILFTGFVQGAMLDELYSNAYIYTLPSDLEGMPLSLLEAMSYGNCCLVSDIPECTEVVEDKALIFQKTNVEDLQEKLQDACDHPEMVMKMKNQAADFICAKYNWDEVVDKTLALYGEKSR